MSKKQLIGHSAPVTSLCYRDGLISSSEDGSIRVWDLETGEKFRHKTTGQVAQAVCDPRVPQIIYFCAQDRVCMIDTRLSHSVSTLITTLKDEVNSLSCHQNGTFLATADDTGRVSVLDLRAKREFKHFRSVHENMATCVAFRPGKTWSVWSGGMDCSVREWDFSKGSCQADFDMAPLDRDQSSAGINPPYVHTIGWSLNGDSFAAGLGNGAIRTMRVIPFEKSQKPLKKVPVWDQNESLSHNWTVSSLDYISNSVLVSGGIDKQVILWRHKPKGIKSRPDHPVSGVTPNATFGDLTQMYTHRCSYKVNAVCGISQSTGFDDDTEKMPTPITLAVGGTMDLTSKSYNIDLVTLEFSE